MNRKDRTRNIRFAGMEERRAGQREPLYVQLRIQITGYLTIGSPLLDGSRRRSHVLCCLDTVNIARRGATANWERTQSSCWSGQTHRPAVTKCPPEAWGGRWPSSQTHNGPNCPPKASKRLFKFLLIACATESVLLECITRSRRFLANRPQRKCGCAVARSLRGPRKLPAFTRLPTQIGQWLIMEIIL